MSDVDALKVAVGAETDLGLAAKLGLERSTISQWRRRGNIPFRYRFMLDPQRQDSVQRGMKHRDRRQLYGDGDGHYLLRAALAVLPAAELDFPELSPALLGDFRESTLVNVISAVLDVCQRELGKARPSSEQDYEHLVNELMKPAGQQRLRRALIRPALGERE